MSGAEASAVIGLIASVITIIETSRQLYDAATNAKGLHAAFREVSTRVPLVLEILRRCKEVQERADQEYRTTTSAARKEELERSAQAVKPIMLICEDNARKLKLIFEKVVPGERATWLERYTKAAQSSMPNKKHQVEDLMKNILEQLQLLHTNEFFKATLDVAAEERSEDINTAIDELSAVPSSLPGCDAANFSNYGSGPQNIHTGTGHMVNNTISGGSDNRQYIAETHYG